MVFLGIGFLLTFLKNYSLTALGFNLIIGALSVQWYVLGKLSVYKIMFFKALYNTDFQRPGLSICGLETPTPP